MEKLERPTEIQLEQPHSVEISINAKGQYSGKVKAYAATVNLAMIKAKQKAEELEQLIKLKNNG